MILAIRSDSPDVYVGLLSNDGSEIACKQWQAGRELSSQLLEVIQELLNSEDIGIDAIQGFVVYEGPGSYTGLRISTAVVNALAYSTQKPVVGSSGDKWLKLAVAPLWQQQTGIYVVPKYGGAVHITKPRK